MATVLRLGPSDHDRPMTLDEFLSGDFEEGHCYELIDGRLYASAFPSLAHNWVNQAAYLKLDHYARSHREIINYVSFGARVFVPGNRITAPAPDLACYCDLPTDLFPNLDWRDRSPILVVEILDGDDEQKDLVRNVDLYWRVASIQEYWVIDIRADAARPILRVYRRSTAEWLILEIPFGTAYETPLLPDFSWRVDPRSCE